jgi:hypothetical protein
MLIGLHLEERSEGRENRMSNEVMGNNGKGKGFSVQYDFSGVRKTGV